MVPVVSAALTLLGSWRGYKVYIMWETEASSCRPPTPLEDLGHSLQEARTGPSGLPDLW